MSSNIKVQKTCQLCGEQFIAQKTTTKYCSHRCGQRAYKMRMRGEKVQTVIQKEIELNALITRLAEKEFLSIIEASQLIGTSRWTVSRMISQGTLKATKLGSRTIIKRTTINNLFK